MPSRDSSPRPAWNEGAIWMGANLPALWRMVGKNRGRIAPRYWLDFAIDSLFASANSMLSMAERVVCARRIRNAPIPHDPIFILGHWRTGTTLLH
ncbi:MAG TPA: hypothetical protein VL096_04425, partial [Pirellulaceae bacterium]|nr:hypothetical protein [Pirellulaceae bacterium]